MSTAANSLDPLVTRSDARAVWSMVPADCKTALSRLKASPQWDQARPVILAEAEAGLRLLGKYTLLDVCASLELAAEHYLEDFPAAHIDGELERREDGCGDRLPAVDLSGPIRPTPTPPEGRAA